MSALTFARLDPRRLVRTLEDPTPDLGTLVFRADDEGFVVHEQKRFVPQESGPHLYLHVEKRGVSTPALVKALCRVYRLKERDVGMAGRKDAHGITRQWLSVPADRVDDAGRTLEGEGPFVVVEHTFHQKKLRLGQLMGNRFVIRVTDGARAMDVLRPRAERLASEGMVNAFGSQRFGQDDRTLDEAERWLARERRAKSRKERFWVSAVQSLLFHHWLVARAADGTLNTALEGDVLLKCETGGAFECTAPDVDSGRIAQREVVVGGPMWGAKMRRAARDAMTAESRSLMEAGVSLDAIVQHPAFDKGTRRAARVYPGDVELAANGADLDVAMTLPAGSYATVFMRELLGPGACDGAPNADRNRPLNG